MTEPTTDAAQPPFSQTLAFLSRGSLDGELAEALAEVVKRVRETGKSGELTLKLKVSMLNARDEDAVKVTPAVMTKLPKLAPFETVMFSTYDGSLLRNDPSQRQLDLREVPKPERGPVQQVGAAAVTQ
jgi:hypothetical protein